MNAPLGVLISSSPISIMSARLANKDFTPQKYSTFSSNENNQDVFAKYLLTLFFYILTKENEKREKKKQKK